MTTKLKFKYQDQRTVKELDETVVWLKEHGWKLKRGFLTHPNLYFSWPWTDAERLQKEVEAGDELAKRLLEETKK